ncbi:hypothetical protein D9615_010072 [Tricholomella constricta]|uniref:methylated diphthine methylhydrolase n=1 Tax=Tricholomella constricta TaxID=117010 RepID=A0A8H5LUX2_9AGAR|nr:hypothetical protein D9615_010072 [Tricholomella constricta]
MSLTTLDTIFPADAVEFCPHPNALDILVCGTYKLEDALGEQRSMTDDGSALSTSAPQHRRGQCLVLQVDQRDATGPYGFRHVQSIDLPAVLDMKWCYRSLSASPILGIADSEGSITLHEWETEEKNLTQVDSIRAPGTHLGSLVVSLSNGSLCLLRPSESSSLSLTNSWHAHDYEPWIAAWNYWDTNIIYSGGSIAAVALSLTQEGISGGDDLKLKGWDVRQNLSQPIFTNKRFDAGVTSIQSHPHVEHLIAVGSYDSTVRIFDTRRPLAALAEVDVGGGAWRVKWHPAESRQDDLLIACMHDGVKIVHLDTGNRRGEVTKHFDSHESMAYGADWSHGPSHEGETIIGSCSFYDRIFHLWSG